MNIEEKIKAEAVEYAKKNSEGDLDPRYFATKAAYIAGAFSQASECEARIKALEEVLEKMIVFVENEKEDYDRTGLWNTAADCERLISIAQSALNKQK